jgi:hypothetical protein
MQQLDIRKDLFFFIYLSCLNIPKKKRKFQCKINFFLGKLASARTFFLFKTNKKNTYGDMNLRPLESNQYYQVDENFNLNCRIPT